MCNKQRKNAYYTKKTYYKYFSVFVCLESIFYFFNEYNTFLLSIFNGIPQEMKKNKIRLDFKKLLNLKKKN